MQRKNKGSMMEQKTAQMEKCLSQIQTLPVNQGNNGPYVHLQKIISRAGISETEAYDHLQAEGLINCKGKWDSELIDFGHVIKHEYYGVDQAKDLERYYSYDLVSPHGRKFFEQFFLIAAGKRNRSSSKSEKIFYTIFQAKNKK